MFGELNKKAIKWLRWSEQYTKTDMVYLAKGSFWTWLGKGTGIVTGVAMSVAFANLLPKEAYGNYKYILSVAGLVGALTLSGITRSITRSVAQGYEGSLMQGVKAIAKWSGIILIAALGISVYYFLQGNNLLGAGMLAVAILQPIIKSAKIYEGHLSGKKLFEVQGIYLTLQEVIQAILIIGVLFFTDNALLLVTALLASNAILNATYLWLTLNNYVSNDKNKTETVSYGKHLSVMRVLETGAKHIDKALIFQLLGAAPTAVYSFAYLPTRKFNDFVRSIGNVVLPKFSDRSFEEIRKSLIQKILITLIASLLLTAILILTMPYIFDLLFPTYTESVIYAQWLAGTLIFIPEFLLTQTLIGQEQTRAMYVINITSDVLRILLLAALITVYGLWGAIYSLFIYLAYRSLAKSVYIYSR